MFCVSRIREFALINYMIIVIELPTAREGNIFRGIGLSFSSGGDGGGGEGISDPRLLQDPRL